LAALQIVNRYKGPVFTDRVGRMKVEEVKLRYEDGFKPVQPARYPVPYHYQERLATNLRKLKAEDVIERVNPAEPVDCILNIAISEKKAQGSIYMNVDARPYNKGAKHTRYHVTTPQEARHKLKGAKVFSEFDMGNGFHQVQQPGDLPVAPGAAPNEVAVLWPDQQLRDLPPQSHQGVRGTWGGVHHNP
jgi:hypothetical protein